MAFTGTPVKTEPGLIYVAPIGTTEPTTATAALPSAWRPVGYTEEGATVSNVRNIEEVPVAEEFYPVRYETTGAEGSVAFSMAEVSRQNLALALNQGANAASSGLLEPPAPGSEVRVMIAIDSAGTSSTANAAPGSTNARYIFRQCFQGGTIDMGFAKSPNKRLIPVTFNMEKPSGAQPWGVFPDANGNV